MVNNLKPERRRTKRAGLRGKGFEILTSLIVLHNLIIHGKGAKLCAVAHALAAVHQLVQQRVDAQLAHVEVFSQRLGGR